MFIILLFKKQKQTTKMTLKIPKTIHGIDGKKAYERIVNGIPEEQTPIVQPIQNPIMNSTEDFIYVPSINLYVAKQRTLLNSNYNECQESLHKENSKMLTIPEFKEFLNYTKDNFLDIYNEITEIRNPWRSEWLDADFKVENRDLFVHYHVFENNNIVRKKEKLDKDILMEDKTPGISLDGWLKDSIKQGLPKQNIASGNLYYWFPRSDNNSVAWFSAAVDGAYLVCDRSPSVRGSSLGVRAAKQRV